MASLEENRISEILWEKMSLNHTRVQEEKDKKDKSLLPGKKFIGKKKKYYFVQRDSQAFRDSPGKPGSKKYNRYLNTLYLKNAQSLSAYDAEFEPSMDFNIYQMNNKNYYQDNQKWSELCQGITSDKQDELLKNYKRSRHYGGTLNSMTDDQRAALDLSFSKLRKSLRPVFKKPFVTNSNFIMKTEELVVDFCQSTQKRMEFYVPDSYQRILLHGIVDYYSLISRSYTNQDGQRVTLISKPKVSPSFPNQTITSYLIQEQQKTKNQRLSSKSVPIKSNNRNRYNTRIPSSI